MAPTLSEPVSPALAARHRGHECFVSARRVPAALPRRATAASRHLLTTALAIALLSAVACGRPDPAPPPLAPPVEGYIVGAPDELLIHILPDPEIEREVRVRPDGKISIDLIGDVQAAGRSPLEIAATIQQEISRFKRDASVSVTVIDSPSQFVTVYGEVIAPGTFPLDTETRVSEAIGQVGGARPFASLNNVRIVRSNGRETEVLDVKLKDIQNGDLSTNYVMREGDLVVVPPTVLAKVGYAFQMLLFPLQPLLSGAATAGGVASGIQALPR